MPAAAVTVTAQWAEGSDFTWDATAQSYTNQQDIATATAEADPISIVFAKETAQTGLSTSPMELLFVLMQEIQSPLPQRAIPS